ncbi:MAG: hypothetical protein JWR34_7028 [Mycobacterium sp.]|nr:hypothetical protein [Mycobacterium sp.]
MDRPVGLLRPLADAPAPRPFGVVWDGSVLIQQEQLARHRVGELLGAGPGGVADPLHLDLGAGGGVQQAGQAGHALADHLDVLSGDQPQRLRGGGGGQHRCQRLTRQRSAGPQHSGGGQPAVRLGARHSPPDHQHLAPRLGTQFARRGLGLQLGQHPVALGGQLAVQDFQLIGGGEEFVAGQRVDAAGGQLLVGSVERGQRCPDRPYLHYSNICANFKGFGDVVDERTRRESRHVE